ncbi:hypothetical protein H6G20_12900 [Desertifilum sp. FACHB-1129]|uniref:DUF4175 domain-containing protein n=2 Tax=Desertifilum tharense IPPAS B-1220 TaxID=1781255 RepID=A0A1E5QIG7_9CYAN|nr:hypothetical protein [Desertifilum tharense]MBD2312562.1 hypothetical protein [Desertifilum sp. FACHB-1129]MBD2320538.1 hypothetical protein [Desertifilum sp. FACHB-866]MBD2330666.1 hypothetical protein [Desertifilum sp. FACHB-868]MCD8488665.1 hypothetical protein [Desertifilum sp.]MDA0210133.1 hypothetical protein [Cyanobacteria bacterium FC1]NES98762.1 hypothetical protein [Desertifilum sp. SIO1I2]
MNRQPGTGTTIFLYIFGISLLVTAVIVVLRGTGVVGWIPGYVIWALVLFSIGAGVLAALKNLNRRW